MSITDKHSGRVTFDTGDELGDMMDKLTVMIGKIAARDNGSGRQFKPQIYQGKRSRQKEVVMINAVMISEVIRIDKGQLVETGDITDKIEEDQGLNKIIEEEVIEVMQGCIKILKNKIAEESTEIILEVKVIAEVKIGTGLEKDHFLETIVMTETTGVQAIAVPDQDQGLAQTETESDVTSVGNTIISQRNVLPPGKKEN